MGLNICMLGTTHEPNDVRILKEAKSLCTRGHMVKIIAPSSNTNIYIHEKIKFITVKKRSKKLHVLTLIDIFKEALKTDLDVVHCHDLDSLVLGVLLKKIKHAKLVYDVHEHWPSEIRYGWFKVDNKILNAPIETVFLLLEKFMGMFCDCIIAVSNSVLERFNKFDEKRTCILPNVAVLSSYNNIINQNEHIFGQNQRIVYMGSTLKLFHGIKEVIMAFSNVKNVKKNVLMVLIGNLDPDVNDLINHSNIADIIPTGVLSKDKMYDELNKENIGLLTFKPDYYNISIGLPNKLFDYMICGLPIVASDLPEIRRVIDESHCGILVDPTNIQEITDAIIWLLEHPEEAKQMGENGRRAVEEKYNWENMEKRLFKVYEELS